MGITFAFVHHANQYLITEGYENRHGLRAAIGSIESRCGYAWILELHRRSNIPVNLHLSGTLMEAIAWQQPAFLLQIRELLNLGLIELVGSCYAQNVMRFFNYEHNLKQLNEELLLYKIHLGIDPDVVKVFWPPERVWDTHGMAQVLTDARLLNHGYQYVLLDDRLLLPTGGCCSPRKIYDSNPRWDVQLHKPCRIENGYDLVALPIASHLRLNIPPNGESQLNELREHCLWLAAVEGDSPNDAVIAIYGDDMEKAAGVGAWNKDGPEQFQKVLRWIRETPSIRPMRICDWAANGKVADRRPIDLGTFYELANHFAAGEGYDKWFYDPEWDRYRDYFSWTERRVNQFSSSGADAALIDLAEKHLLASSWETAWHTPPEGPFGNPVFCGQPSPWIRALGSHCRHAAVIAEAAHWAIHYDELAHATLCDIDGDSEDELVLKNEKLFAVISPRWGGRLVALFDLESPAGKMVIGNPADDWNWMQELNRFMEVPPNHPGALTDSGYEHDEYEPRIAHGCGSTVEVELQNIEACSLVRGLLKHIRLTQGENRLRVSYSIPEGVGEISVDFAFSPDYLNLLRYGRTLLIPFQERGALGWSANSTAVWVREEECGPLWWSRPFSDEPGHKASLRLSTLNRKFTISIGVSRT
jgi:hypothetical protein